MSSDPGDDAAQPRSLRDRVSALLSGRSRFTINVAKVSTGSVLRFAIAFGTMPIVTRLYEPEDFGNVQLLLSIVGSFLAISTLKYELAIVLPRDRVESQRMAVLCLWVVGLLAMLIALLCFFFGDWFLGLFDAQRLQPWIGLVVVGFVVGGVMRTTQYALIAGQAFGTLARAGVAQVGTTQASYIGLGLWHPSFLGMFAGQIAGQSIGIAVALRRAPIRLGGVRARELWQLARRYRKFPLVNTPGVFINTVAQEAPVFLLARFFEAEIVGFYMLAERLLGQPMLLIGEAISKVYLQSAAEAAHRSAGELRRLFRRTASRLLLIMAPFAAGVALLAPWATDLVLGDRYREVGVIMQILILGTALRFASRPLFPTFSVIDRQEVGVALMVVASVGRVAAMFVFSGSAHQMLLALMASNVVAAFLYLLGVDRVLARMPADAPVRSGSV